MSKRKFDLMLEASSEQELHQKLAKEYGVDPKKLTIKPTGSGRFRVEGEALPSRVMLRVDQDGMTAWVTRITPALGGGQAPLTKEQLAEKLKEQGVVFGLDQLTLKTIAARLTKQGKVDEEMVVARGQQPKAESLKLSPQVKPGACVAQGTVVCQGGGGEGSLDIIDVRGQKRGLVSFMLEGQAVSLGEGFEPAADGQGLQAAAAGCLEQREGVLRLVRLLAISEDGLEVKLHRPAGGRLTLEDVKKELSRLGVVQGLDNAAVTAALDTPAGALEIVVARGLAPKQAEDDRLELLVDLAEKVGVEHEDGSVDFYERNLITNVLAGQELIRIHQGTDGCDGCDVLGRVIKSTTRQKTVIKPGENIIVEEGGRLRAKVDGCVQYDGESISVCDSYEVSGDVDFNTGNIDCSGLLQIHGTVRSGFRVRGGKDIHIKGAIEDAIVDGEKDILVGGGILMKGGRDREAAGHAAGETGGAAGAGQVRAKGSVHINFATNARVRAGKDILVANAAINCELGAAGKVIAMEGKGTIIGGSIFAAGGAEVRVLGSEAAVRTDVVLDALPDVHAEMEQHAKERETIAAELAKIKGSLTGDKVRALSQGTDEQKQALAKLLKHIKTLQERDVELTKRDGQLRELIAAARKSRLRVYGEIYPGVNIRIYDVQLKVDKQVHGYEFYLDEAEGKIMRQPVVYKPDKGHGKGGPPGAKGSGGGQRGPGAAPQAHPQRAAPK